MRCTAASRKPASTRSSRSSDDRSRRSRTRFRDSARRRLANASDGITGPRSGGRVLLSQRTDGGAQVVGISSDSAASHAAFAQAHRLPFPLVSDAGGKVRKAYGVPKAMGILPGRVTYVIDRSGIVRSLFNSMFEPRKHVAAALDVLKTLA